MIEGVLVKGSEISKRYLLAIWRSLSSDPLPAVRAFQLLAKDFNHILRVQKCLDDEIREVEEWGRILSVKGTDACVFNSVEVGGAEFIILIRRNHYHPLNEILKHELSHIASGDL